MLSCDEASRYIARTADTGTPPEPTLQVHLEGCARCRAALEEQRLVIGILRDRPADVVSTSFAARLDARLGSATGWVGLADWRTWTLRLSPAAAALALAAFLSSDAATASPSLADWTMSGPEAASKAALLWEPDATAETVVETMLAPPDGSGGNGDAR